MAEEYSTRGDRLEKKQGGINPFSEKEYLIPEFGNILVYEGNHRVIITQRDSNCVVYNIDTVILQNSEGKLLSSIVFCEDQTEKKRMEEKVEMMEKLSIAGELAAGAVHEIKNPLSAIRGFAQLLENSFNEADERREYTNIIINEIDRLSELIKEFLVLTKPGNRHYSKESINKVIGDIVPLIQTKAVMNNVSIKTSLCEEIPEISMNKEHMKQVFLNLFNNAIEAMPQGGELFVITTYQDNDIKIEIIDTGCGILPENIKKLFKPFFTTKEEGTGLGLSICKRIIENHKGSISVDSNPGKGSTFTIHLPVLM